MPPCILSSSLTHKIYSSGKNDWILEVADEDVVVK